MHILYNMTFCLAVILSVANVIIRLKNSSQANEATKLKGKRQTKRASMQPLARIVIILVLLGTLILKPAESWFTAGMLIIIAYNLYDLRTQFLHLMKK
jgi:hypothetical protein